MVATFNCVPEMEPLAWAWVSARPDTYSYEIEIFRAQSYAGKSFRYFAYSHTCAGRRVELI